MLRVLIIGGSGQLGGHLVDIFSKDWETVSIDFIENP
jgi:dTDP-4-dehydrorhamnose reductase